MQHKDLCLASAATLIACKSIAQAFSENIYELAHLRQKWSVEYAESLKKKIQTVTEKHLSDETLKISPEKVDAWRDLMISAFTDLAIIRASVKVDFKEDKEFQKDFFNRMGYTQYFSDAKNGDHASMYNFIREFANQLTPDLRDKITGNGLDPNIVDRIAEDARSAVQFSECFEVLNDPETIADEGRQLVEEIYREIQDICRICTAYFHFDPNKREGFNFFKALRKLPL